MRMADAPDVSVLVPVYNEQESIGAVLTRVLALDLSLEVIVVDDGSTDQTVERVRGISDHRVRLVRQPRNLGKTAAIEQAIAQARGKVVVIQDADLEYDPAEIPFVVGPILEDRADVVYGSRFLVRRAARVLYYYHFLANHVLTALSNLFTNLNLTDVETGYKAFRRDLVKDLPLTSRGFGMEIELTASIADLPLRVYEVPISYYGRTYAEGKKIGLSDGFAALWYIIYFNTLGRLERHRRKHREHVALNVLKVEPTVFSSRRAPGATFTFGVSYFLIAIGFLFLMSRFYRPDVGFTPMLLFGEQFQANRLPELGMMPSHVAPGAGYDGQFYAQMAVRPAPWAADIQQALDNSWYRFSRILPSLIACAVGLGHPVWTVQAYAAQFLVVWLLVALLLVHWFPPGSLRNMLCWSGLMLSSGMMMSVCRALPDAWALALVALAFYFRGRDRPLLGAGFLGAAVLARETAVLAILAYLGRWKGTLRVTAACAALALLPGLAWAGCLRVLGGEVKVTGAFELPFVALWTRWLTVENEFWLSVGTFAALVGLTTQAAFFLLRWRPYEWPWRLGIVHVVLMAMLGPAVWEGAPSAASRVLLPMHLAFNLAVPRSGARWWPVLLLGNASIVSGVIILGSPPP